MQRWIVWLAFLSRVGTGSIASLYCNLHEATYSRSAEAFDNPDFVDVVIHSCRHRYGLVAGDPAMLEIQRKLQQQPTISVASVTIDGDVDGVNAATAHHAAIF